ncbi:MAG: cysteine--1-D-myo-inosityl 2-amino-2-deoxy-alpha-D-glucopyranoside ligase [Actinomycetota bacterium]|nr:cysteine--1-D-myo-inosityl 2-amino-2-deoxy-alpha-D-glucopyranoside ligase [Actinomycetota bacterium]
MRAWNSATVPCLGDLGHGTAALPRIHDTATGTMLEVGAAARTARLYVCGITPYDATHLGHAATYVAFDTLVRVWLDAGREVTYTQNVTDVDDPLLERAAATQVDWRELAERETELFRTDMQALRVLAPQHFQGAVESIPLVVDLIQRLVDRGAAYSVEHDLYFDVHSDPGFGSVSCLDAERMRILSAERGGDPDRAGKRDPLDCLLWLAARPGEPSWESPFGPGRPGWHVECAAIALAHLGPGLDVQGGGNDLVFPHHEMSASQAQVACQQPFAHAYAHAGMLGYDGAKMSKSGGNLVLVSRLRETGVESGAVRLALLAHHYRSDWAWTDAALAAGEARLVRWRDAVSRASGPPAAGLVDMVRAALHDDLDTPRALAAVDVWADAVLGGSMGEEHRVDHPEESAPDTVRTVVDALLGVRL